jgi:hypothetical protein
VTAGRLRVDAKKVNCDRKRESKATGNNENVGEELLSICSVLCKYKTNSLTSFVAFSFDWRHEPTTKVKRPNTKPGLDLLLLFLSLSLSVRKNDCFATFLT